ncbi:AAA-domain-containing protein [Parathielavia appendiculata]|uniref:AAA-domain-containing protein n=1 Tax=Parathielavia appendiculata TaxID=2587402 RepID=A0AAN6TU47_9PEZI|nr:AAA-domain-containing protein [Parathielavia appendiculata]
MPTAAGARALLSAKARQRLPRVAADANSTVVVAFATLHSILPHRLHALCSPHDTVAAIRGFHTSSSLLNRPDDPNSENAAPSADSNKDKETGTAAGKSQSIETPKPAVSENSKPVEGPARVGAEPAVAAAIDVDARREKLKSAGYGSARARANRNSRVEEHPAPKVPLWFLSDWHVSLYEFRALGVPATRLPPLGEEDHQQLMMVMENVLDQAALSEAEVQRQKDMLLRFATRYSSDDSFVRRLPRSFQAFHAAAFFQALLAVYHSGADSNEAHVELLRQHHADHLKTRPLWWPLPEKLVSGEAQRWLANARFDAPPGSGIHISPLAKRPEPEYSVCMELLAAVQSQLATHPLSGNRPDLRPPPVVLAMLNCQGPTIANKVIEDIATDLKADVVHFSAHSIARLVGGYLGQNQYSARGSVSMLGYAAAEMNGRLALRPDAESDQVGMVAVELPSRLRSFLSPREGSAAGLSSGRWEDMQMGTALEGFIAAVNTTRQLHKHPPYRPLTGEIKVEEDHRDLIIHIHDYVELSSLYPALLHKFRAVADRVSMAGRKVIVVGSSGSDMSKSQWRDQLDDLGRDGNAHVIPFHASEKDMNGVLNSVLANLDNRRQNIDNIEDMLGVMVGDQVPITFNEFSTAAEEKIPEQIHKVLGSILDKHVYDAQWVHRLVSLMVGGQTGPRDEYGPSELAYAVQFMLDRNKRWADVYPSVRPPYCSPLSIPRSPASYSSDDPPDSSISGETGTKEYSSAEKKLLSGLINAKDIHTTFNDIVVPQETKESLIGLTTLSLIRPEAFSYGVLKTEHIPGCLLYGPPGTGKTLLAKAVAKESGASVLEVSAADINDKWVGQSEKNVQALFSLARRLAPCVIFLDEADALLAARRSGAGRAAHREVITQFLREWDGLTGSPAGKYFIMVATNRPFDLDEAVLRRLPRKILVDLPLTPEREAILRVMLKEETLAPDVDLAALARETELYSGSDLKNLCVSAAMEAVREEVRAKEAWTGEAEYQFPERRVLEKRHFDKGLRDISASISGDMESLKAIRKFDEQYGDAGRKRKIRRGIGFEVVPDDGKGLSGEARVRQVGTAAA